MYLKIFKSVILFVIVGIGIFYSTEVFALELSRDNLGLNVHWALGGNYYDYDYELKLDQSETQWAREHFSAEVLMGENSQAWWDRYDFVVSKYQALGINIVGMLAYGPDSGVFTRPDLDWWQEYITAVVDHYHDRVSVWEVWNEPDSPDYLLPNTATNYKDLLTIAYETIKEIDPQATVLSAGLAQADPSFLTNLLAQADGYFDGVGLHSYYCQDYVSTGNINQLQTDIQAFNQLLRDQRSIAKIWITEIGCSIYSSTYSQSVQTNFLSQATEWLSSQNYIAKIFLYTFRDSDSRSDYENNFGLLELDFKPKSAWTWYLNLPDQPSDRQYYYGVERHGPLETVRAYELHDELERYFGEGLIPIAAQNWPIVVNAYAYGAYPVQAIVQAIRYGGYTVSPEIPFVEWQTHQSYIDYINRNWTGGMIVFAYDKPRVSLTTEQEKARELRQLLEQNYNLSQLRITAHNWNTIVNAYVYGEYPVAAIARAVVFGGKTVHPEIGFGAWQYTDDYQNYINRELP